MIMIMIIITCCDDGYTMMMGGSPSPPPSSHNIKKSAADAWIDEQLQRHLFFGQSAKRAEVDATLSDGTRVRKGDVIGFHYGR